MTRVGFFSGSFDPMTNGHLDVIGHAAALCDRLVVGVGSNPNKAALFTVEERLKLIHEAAAPIMAKVDANSTSSNSPASPSKPRARQARR